MTRQAYIVVDLGNGDAGKGTLTDALTRRHGAHTIFRFNGGGQAGHNVVTPDGRHHCFSQFGSGMFVEGTVTCHTRDVLISPDTMLLEAGTLAAKGVPDAFARTLISEQALIVTPFHRTATRLRELARGKNRHGSVGVGVGEAARMAVAHPELALRAKDLRGSHPEALRQLLQRAQNVLRMELRDELGELHGRPEAQVDRRFLEGAGSADLVLLGLQSFAAQANIVNDHALRERLALDGTVIFEGAQGVLIDEDVGFFPYVTRSHCTTRNALKFLDDARYQGHRERVGVLRAYAVRHGPGPFVSEDPHLGARLHEAHNAHDAWQGAFRHGHFDAVATRYALKHCPVDCLAITGLDQLAGIPAQACVAYDLSYEERIDEIVHDLNPHHFPGRARLTARLLRAKPILQPMQDPVGFITEKFPLPLLATSYGPTATDKRWFPDQNR